MALEWTLVGLHVLMFSSQRKSFELNLGDFISILCLLLVNRT
jgi:hypothetical protein